MVAGEVCQGKQGHAGMDEQCPAGAAGGCPALPFPAAHSLDVHSRVHHAHRDGLVGGGGAGGDAPGVRQADAGGAPLELERLAGGQARKGGRRAVLLLLLLLLGCLVGGVDALGKDAVIGHSILDACEGGWVGRRGVVAVRLGRARDGALRRRAAAGDRRRQAGPGRWRLAGAGSPFMARRRSSCCCSLTPVLRVTRRRWRPMGMPSSPAAAAAAADCTEKALSCTAPRSDSIRTMMLSVSSSAGEAAAPHRADTSRTAGSRMRRCAMAGGPSAGVELEM